VKRTDCQLDLIDERGNNLLHRAVLAGREEMARYISKKCKDLAVKFNYYGLAPIHLALLSDCPGLVETLLLITQSRFKDIRTQSDHLSLLQYIAKNSHPMILKFYLTNFAGSSKTIKKKINEGDELGRTAMHFAAASGFRETISVLHAHGGDLFMRDHKNMLPFHHSLANGYTFTAQFITKLMNSEPEKYINDDLKGSSCLLKCCQNSFDPLTLRYMLACKANPHKRDLNNNDALYYARKNEKIAREVEEILLLSIKSAE
jgi:ankyrin repeat protein